jgi:hypothetical protein
MRAAKLAASGAFAHHPTSATSMGPGMGEEENRARKASDWLLRDAKARSGEVERPARVYQPRRAAVHGHDAIVVIATEDDNYLQPPLTGAAIVETLHRSPLCEVELERVSTRAPIRDVGL